MFGGTINSSSRTNPRFRAIAQIIYNNLVRPGYRTGNCASDHHYDAGNIYQHAYFFNLSEESSGHEDTVSAQRCLPLQEVNFA